VFSGWRRVYLFDLVLKEFDVAERIDNNFVDGVVQGFDFDVNEGLLLWLV
jgi:hypothetical protein